MNIPKDWLMEIANKLNNKWETTFCQKCGKDLPKYGKLCKTCLRDDKLEKLIKENEN